MLEWLSTLPRVFGGVWTFARRPKLVLSAEPREPWCVQTPMNCPPGRNPVEWVSLGLANYYRVRVVNDGKTTAKGCHVQLTGVWFVERGLWKRLAGWQAVDLIWSGSPGVRTKDLSPRQPDFADVGHVFSSFLQSNAVSPTSVRVLYRDAPAVTHHARFMLDLHTQFNAQPNALERGHYVMELSAFSENAATMTLRCDLWVSGEFAQLGDTSPLANTILNHRGSLPEEDSLDHDPPPDGWQCAGQ